MEKVKVAFVGAGAHANRVHYPSLAEMEDVRIVGICDLNEKRLVETSEKFKIEKKYVDYKKMIEETSPDAVYIIMPPHQMFDIVVYCLNAGLNVFIEKPPGITTTQIKSMAKLAEKKGVLTMVGFQRRFAPIMVEVKRRVEKRGEITLSQARFFKNFTDELPYFNGATDLLTSDGIHAVDILRYLLGEAKKIKSIIKSIDRTYNNLFCAIMEFENGAIGILSTNWFSGKRIFSVEIHGKNILAFVDPEKEAEIYEDGKEEGEILKTEEIAESKDFFRFAGFYFENRHFIESIKTKKLPQTNFMDAVKTMELIDKIYSSLF
jgi:predicted dehydrogenase